MKDRRAFLSQLATIGLAAWPAPISISAQTVQRYPTAEKIRAGGPEYWQLVDLINGHRTERELPRIALSPRLTTIAYLHARDLATNRPHVKHGSMHSWSNDPRWTGGAYRANDPATHKIMWDKPKEITGYPAYGFEICVAKARGVEHAFEVWTNSALHHNVIVNAGAWAKPRWQWKAIGAVYHQGFACGWFGAKADVID